MVDMVFDYLDGIEYEKDPVFSGSQEQVVEWLKANYSDTNNTYYVRIGETMRLISASVFLVASRGNL